MTNIIEVEVKEVSKNFGEFNMNDIISSWIVMSGEHGTAKIILSETKTRRDAYYLGEYESMDEAIEDVAALYIEIAYADINQHKHSLANCKERYFGKQRSILDLIHAHAAKVQRECSHNCRGCH